MKKLSSKLFEKQINLKSCEVYGGRDNATFTTCSESTSSGGCSDSSTTTYDDAGGFVRECVSYDCP